jgi:hypothetical protein
LPPEFHRGGLEPFQIGARLDQGGPGADKGAVRARARRCPESFIGGRKPVEICHFGASVRALLPVGTDPSITTAPLEERCFIVDLGLSRLGN